MSQEYIEDKKRTLKKLNNGQRIVEALLLVVGILALYLMVALFSFDPADPGWSQTAWHEPVHNFGGAFGAWVADTLFFTFGALTYSIPFIILILISLVLKQRRYNRHLDYFTLSLRLIGALALIITSCGLAASNIDDIYYFASGGVIGSLLANAMQPWFSHVGATMVLLCVWAAGLTLFTGWSWLVIAEKLGALILNSLALFLHRSVAEESIEKQGSAEEEQIEIEGKEVKIAEEDALLFRPSEEVASDTDPLLYGKDPLIDIVLGKESVQPSDELTLFTEPGEPESELSFTTTEQSLSPLFSQPLVGSWEEQPEQFITDDQFTVIGGSKQTDPMWTLATEFNSGAAEKSNDDVALDELPNLYSASAEAQITAQTPYINPGLSPEITPIGAASRDLEEEQEPFFSPAPPKSQTKKGLGVELPRPNPVRIPSRRELASYGIKLPSQRQAELEEKQKKEELDIPSESVEQQQERLQMETLRQEFEARQRERYGDDSSLFLAEDGERETPIDLSQVELLQDGEISPLYFEEEEEILPAQPLFAAEEQMAEPLLVQESPLLREQGEPESEQRQMASDSLIHPFLMRHEMPLTKPTTPLPTLDLLALPEISEDPVDEEMLHKIARLIEVRLADYRVKARVVGISPGPVVTLFELELAPGVKAARISNLSRDLARSLSAVAVRIVEVIPGKPYVGLELPNEYRQTVQLREVLDCSKFRENPSPLAVVLGKDIGGQPVVADLAKMPHLLVAGTTGSGKSVGVNAMIISILYKAKPEEVKFIMIDPKMLELSVYEGIPHLLTEVVTDMKDAANALRWCVNEMEKRYKLMSVLGVRNIAGYNERIQEAEEMGRPIPDPFWKPGDGMSAAIPMLEKLPYIVVMVDEFADLIMAVGKKVEELIARLAQKARAAGIHLVLATQRPSVDVITGLIKANIPTRIAFTVSSKIDSRTILDQGGAESLLGMGDMLYLPPNSSLPIRVHGAFVRDQEVHAVVQDWKARGRPSYVDGILSTGDEGENGGVGFDDEELDPLFDQAVEFVVEKRKASISGVQRQFRIGYNRAARIVEQMEAQGIVSPPGNNGNREVLAPPTQH